MKSVTIAALVLLCAACGPTPPPPDAREFVPEAIPPGGPQPWERGTPKPTATPTPRFAHAASMPTAPPTARAVESQPTVAPSEMTPAELKGKVLDLMRQGLDRDLILAYVSRQRLSSKLTVDDVLEWKRAGISDEVIKAAAAL